MQKPHFKYYIISSLLENKLFSMMKANTDEATNNLPQSTLHLVDSRSEREMFLFYYNFPFFF